MVVRNPLAHIIWRGFRSSFSILDLEYTLQPFTAKELATEWTNIKTRFASRGPNVSEN